MLADRNHPTGTCHRRCGMVPLGFPFLHALHPASLLAVLLVIAAWALGACSGAIPKEDAEVETLVAVQVGAVAKADLHVTVDAYGIVEPEPAKAGYAGGGAKLSAPGAAIVHAVHVVEGQAVKAGDMVVQLDDRMAQAMIDKARNAVVFARQVAERQEQMLRSGATSLQAKQDAQQRLAIAAAEYASAQAAISQVQLASPLDGIVTRVYVQPGQTVDLNTVVAEIIDLKRLVVTVAVPAEEAARIEPEQEADIFADYGTKPAATGRVSFVSPAVDPKTGALMVRLALPEGTGLRPGQFVRARIVSGVLPDRLVVPHESVVKVEGKDVIYVVEGDKATQLPVKTGVREGDLLEVQADGLKQGERIVTVGAYGLPKETKVKVTGP